MIPADCLFCVRINNLDQALGQLDQFLLGVSPMNLGMMAKMQLGQVLGNASLAGLKTDGTFVVFGTMPSDAKGLEALAQGLSILVPISDYGQFTASSPKIGKPDPNGVSALEGMPAYVTNLGGFALVGPSASAGGLAGTAKSLKAGPAKSLAGVLDAGEAAAATKEPLWIYGNIQVLAKVLGPGVADKIRQAGEKMGKMQAGATPGMDTKAVFDIYANLADTLLKETKSVAITITPKPTVLVVSTTVAALPGTSMADLLTKSTPSGTKAWNLLGYLEDGAMMNGAACIDPACLIKFNEKTLDLLASMGGKKASDEDVKRIKAIADDMAAALGKEVAFSATPQAKGLFAAKYVFEVKDQGRWQKVFDRMTELFTGPGAIASFYDAMGIKMAFTIQHGAATYQGVTLDSAKLTFSFKDPNSTQAQMLQKMYGEGFDYRMATVDRLGLMVIGNDADANIRKLIDQVKAGGPKETSSEIKTALELLPEAKNADMICTLNYLRAFSAMVPAMMPMPMPPVSFQSKSNLVFAGTLDKGRANVLVALPKEHLTEIVQAVQQMMMTMQQQQQQQKPPQQNAVGPKPTPQG